MRAERDSKAGQAEVRGRFGETAEETMKEKSSLAEDQGGASVERKVSH